MRHKLEGNWRVGYATDLHTVASTYVGLNEYGHGNWDNVRSEMGELVYRLKNHGDLTTIPKIVDLLKSLGGIEKFDAIIPVPSSNKDRPFQPVDEICKALGAQRGVPVLIGFLTRTAGEQIKNVSDPNERKALLAGSIRIAGTEDITGMDVLLVDDLYRSGATLSECCTVLREGAAIGSVSVLAMTKTRSKR
jgi:competence protein ComFC